MLVIPAVDIKAGSCVRLVQGDPNRQTVYSPDPVEMARRWTAQGSQRLHVVDLDGALGGGVANLDLVFRIKETVNTVVQFGGGLRDLPTVRKVLSKGIGRAIVGTAILKDPAWIREALAEFPGRMMASVDCVEGEFMIEGWQADSGLALKDAIRQIEEMGFREIIFTDIRMDGMMQGPNLQAIEQVLGLTRMGVYASGGVSSLDHIKSLKGLEPKGLKGCIIGKALYAGTINLPNAIAAAK